MAAWTHRVATSSTANASTYASGAFTPSAADLAVAMVNVSQCPAGGSLTGSANGLNFSLVANGDRATTDNLCLFVANQLVPTSPASMTVTYTASGGTPSGAVIFVATLSGMLRYGPLAVRQSQWAKGASGTPAATMPAAALTGNPVIGFVGNALNPAAMTPPTSFTENAAGDTGHATPVKGSEYAYRDSGHTSATVTWGNSLVAAWAAIVAEFDTTAMPSRPPRPNMVSPSVQIMRSFTR